MSQDEARSYMNEILFLCAGMAAYIANTIFKRDRHPDGSNLLKSPSKKKWMCTLFKVKDAQLFF